MPHCRPRRTQRPYGRDVRRRLMLTIVGSVCLLSLAGLGSAIGPSVAYGNATEFCQGCVLKPGYGVEWYSEHYILEMESWNSDGKGFGSCIASVNSISNQIQGEACSTPVGKGYNEAYCKSACHDKWGYAWVGNNSPYTSVFTGWEDYSGSAAAPPNGASETLAQRPDASAAAVLKVLRRVQSSCDAIPAEVSGSVTNASGANPALARRARGLRGGAAWVVPGSGDVCLIAEAKSGTNGGASCAADEAADSGVLTLETRSAQAPGVIFVAGMVPDGVSNVTLTLEGGTTQVLPVHENVYMHEVDGTPVAVTLSGAAEAIPLAMVSPTAE